MIRMLGHSAALTMALGALVACGGPSPTGPTTSASAVERAEMVVGESSSDTELEGTVIADGDECTSATQLVSL